MNALTKSIVDVCEATAVPEVIGQGDGATDAANKILSLVSIIREQDAEIERLRALLVSPSDDVLINESAEFYKSAALRPLTAKQRIVYAYQSGMRRAYRT
jgi:hypothetical protein